LSLREAQALAVRERLLDGAVELIEAGEEPSMRAVAKRAEVGERTVYRYFPRREDLHEAVRLKLSGKAGSEICDSVDGLEDYVRTLYTRFGEHPQLIAALVRADWAATHFRESRRRNLDDLRRLLDDAYPGAPATERQAVALALRVPLSGAGWLYQRDCGLDTEAAIAQGQWLVRTMLERLGGDHA